jgi:hypothetical protein
MKPPSQFCYLGHERVLQPSGRWHCVTCALRCRPGPTGVAPSEGDGYWLDWSRYDIPRDIVSQALSHRWRSQWGEPTSHGKRKNRSPFRMPEYNEELRFEV